MQSAQLQFVAAVSLLLIAYASAQESPSPLLSALVPKQKTDNVEVTGEGDQYHLRINTPDGGREENVELDADKQLNVKGAYLVTDSDKGTQWLVVYKADKNGYVAKWTYGPIRLTLSSDLLRSAAG